MVFSISYNPPKIWNKSLSGPSNFQHKVKSWGTGIWFIILRMGPNRKYLLRLHTPPLFLPTHWKKNRQIVWNQIKIDFWNCFDSLEMCDKTQSVYCLSVPFRLIRSICFLSVKCENMYFMRKIKFMPCHWEFLFYQTCLGRSVCNRKI